MTQIDLKIERRGDWYHATSWQGEAKFLEHGDDSAPLVKEIERSVRPDSDEDNARIWHAAERVFDSAYSDAVRQIGANPGGCFVGDPPNQL